jgi:hypothetical protein
MTTAERMGENVPSQREQNFLKTKREHHHASSFIPIDGRQKILEYTMSSISAATILAFMVV